MSYPFQAHSTQFYIGLYILEDKMTEFTMDKKTALKSEKQTFILVDEDFSSAEVMTRQGTWVLWRKQADGQLAALL